VTPRRFYLGSIAVEMGALRFAIDRAASFIADYDPVVSAQLSQVMQACERLRDAVEVLDQVIREVDAA